MEPQTANAVSRATGEFLDRGILGVLCLILIVVVVYLYRTARADARERAAEDKLAVKARADELKELNERHAEELRVLRTEHADEIRVTIKEYKDQMQTFFERHAAKAETWAAQGADMTSKFNQAFEKFVAATEALARRGNRP